MLSEQLAVGAGRCNSGQSCFVSARLFTFADRVGTAILLSLIGRCF
jgi:hypothetical protein